MRRRGARVSCGAAADGRGAGRAGCAARGVRRLVVPIWGTVGATFRRECSPSLRQVVRFAGVADEAASQLDDGGVGGDDGVGSNGGGGDGNGGGGDGDGEDPNDNLLGFFAAEKLSGGGKLPVDFVEAARCGALRRDTLTSFLALQAKLGSLAWILHRFGFVRDRLVYDDRFLFKMGAEVLIDSGCATFAEVKKRAEDFWDEIEFYASDLVVGCVLDCVLVTLLAPASPVWGGPQASKLLEGAGVVKLFKRYLASLPSAAAARGAFSARQRAASFAVTGGQYAVSGFIAGILGQALANAAIVARRSMLGQSVAPEDVKTQPIFKTAIVWTLFMGLSSNTRYQAVYLFERMFEGTALAKSTPALANAFTVAVRFGNNIIGGMQFIDMARYFGVQ